MLNNDMICFLLHGY